MKQFLVTEADAIDPSAHGSVYFVDATTPVRAIVKAARMCGWYDWTWAQEGIAKSASGYRTLEVTWSSKP